MPTVVSPWKFHKYTLVRSTVFPRSSTISARIEPGAVHWLEPSLVAVGDVGSDKVASSITAGALASPAEAKTTAVGLSNAARLDTWAPARSIRGKLAFQTVVIQCENRSGVKLSFIKGSIGTCFFGVGGVC